MDKKIKYYLEEQQHEVKDNDYIEDLMFYEITVQHSQSSWCGLASVSLEKVVLNSGEVLYIVQEEDATELIKQNAPTEKIIDTLTNSNHEVGDFNITAIFDTEVEARDFIQKEYEPFESLEKAVREMLLEELYGIEVDGEIVSVHWDKEMAISALENEEEGAEIVHGYFDKHEELVEEII